MAIPRFSFGSGATGLYNPNQVLVPTTLTSEDRAKVEDYKTRSEAYDAAVEKYKAEVDAYNKAIEKYNAGARTSPFTQTAPTQPADPGFTQEELDAFNTAAQNRAQQLQVARQNAVNLIQNPEGFSQQYGVGSLSFASGGFVPNSPFGNSLFSRLKSNVGTGIETWKDTPQPVTTADDLFRASVNYDPKKVDPNNFSLTTSPSPYSSTTQSDVMGGGMGSPMMGSPMMGSPMMGSPMMGIPMMGSPMMGSPMMGGIGSLPFNGLSQGPSDRRVMPRGGNPSGLSQYGNYLMNTYGAQAQRDLQRQASQETAQKVGDFLQQVDTLEKETFGQPQYMGGFNQFPSMGGLGSSISPIAARMEKGGEVKQGGVVDLGAAGFTVTPDIFMEYGSGSSKIPTDVDGKQLYLDERWKEGYGQLGFDVETPNRHRFGARASGNYYKGEINFPEALQRFGAPAKETFGTKGIRPEQYSAYYQTPEGTRVSGRYQEGTPERERGFEVMLSKQFGTDDLMKRISRFLEKNRP